MSAVLSKIGRGQSGLAHLLAQAANNGKYWPTLVLAVECEDDVMIAQYRGIFMLPQGRIREGERFEETSWRILTDEFGMNLPGVSSAEWSRSVTQIAFYHKNDLDPERRSEGKVGKMLVFVKVTVSSMDTNLKTEWNRTREPNPPEAVEWVRVVSKEDIEAIRLHYFHRIRTEAKRNAELGIIAIARGIQYTLPS